MFYPIQTPNQLTTHLRALRRAKKWTQTQLAAKLGLSQTRVARIEKDPLSVSTDQLLRVLAALDASVLLQTTEGAGAEVASVAPAPAAGAEPIHADIW